MRFYCYDKSISKCFIEYILIPNRAIYEHLLLHFIPSARMSRDDSPLSFPNGFNSEEGEERGILQNKETHSQISNKIILKY